MKAFWFSVLACTAAGAADAQQVDTHAHGPVDRAAATAFLDEARTGSARYRNRATAIADGYRRLGPAFPGMGQHWIHPGLIVSGTLDARLPSVLCYADSAGSPSLVGVAYAVPVGPDGTLPLSPAGPDVWHEHSDAVDDETLLLVHPSVGGADENRPRLAMFHAWVWLENPDGPFAQNNWALPFAQLGLSVPDAFTPAAAHALSLLTAGESYYVRLFDVLAQPPAADAAAISAALRAAAERVRQWKSAIGQEAVSADAAALLAEIWADLWTRLDTGVSAATRDRLSGYAGSAPNLMR